jgi:hypothetical protein
MSENLAKIYTEIEQASLPVETIICTVCGCAINTLESTPNCEHLNRLIK